MLFVDKNGQLKEDIRLLAELDETTLYGTGKEIREAAERREAEIDARREYLGKLTVADEKEARWELALKDLARANAKYDVIRKGTIMVRHASKDTEYYLYPGTESWREKGSKERHPLDFVFPFLEDVAGYEGTL